MAVRLLDGSGRLWAVRCCAICVHAGPYFDDPHCRLHGSLDDWYEIQTYALCGDFVLDPERKDLRGAFRNG